MKIVIGKDGVKREITGPFNICGSKKDLDALVKCIQDTGVPVYGWVRIVDSEPCIPNTPPLKWTQHELEVEMSKAGTPYSVGEARMATQEACLDTFHKELILFLCDEAKKHDNINKKND